MSIYRITDYGDQDFSITEVDESGGEIEEINAFADVEDVLDFLDDHEDGEFEIAGFDNKVLFDHLSAGRAREEVEQR